MKEDLDKFAGESQPASSPSQLGAPGAPSEVSKPSKAAGSSSSGSGQPEQQCLEDQKGVQGPGASGEGKEQTDDGDLTQVMGKDALTLKGVTKVSASQQEQFEKCTLVVPSVTLNKFKQLESTPCDLSKYVGVLGADTCKMYKLERVRLCTMMMGDFVSNPDDFWEHAVLQLKNWNARAFFLFDVFQGNKDEASFYTWFQHRIDKQEV